MKVKRFFRNTIVGGLVLCLIFTLSSLPVAYAEDAIIESSEPESLTADQLETAAAIDALEEEGGVQPGKVLLVLREDADEEAVVEETHEIADVNEDVLAEDEKLVVVETPADESLGEAIERYKGDPDVLIAQPNYRYYPAENPVNDTYYSSQWALQPAATANVPAAWSLVPEPEAKIRVAVLDSGVDISHPDLKGSIAAGTAFNTLANDSAVDLSAVAWPSSAASLHPGVVPSATNITDDLGHGTHVAGIVAATRNNGRGVAGVAGGYAEIVPVKVFHWTDYNNDGVIQRTSYTSGTYTIVEYFTYTSELVEGIEYAVSQGCRVVNMSLGGYAESDNDSTVADAITAAKAVNVMCVCAAGNGNGGIYTDSSWPSDYSDAISVTATTSTNTRVYFSDYGPAKDIAAPGDNIYSTYPVLKGSYTTMSGTSMATPFVSGVLALMLAANPNLTWTQCTTILYGTATPAASLPVPTDYDGSSPYSYYYGAGLVNAGAAVQSSRSLYIVNGAYRSPHSFAGEPYAVGTAVNLSSTAAPTGYAFDTWTTTGGTLTSATSSSSAKITLPSSIAQLPVTVTATYKVNSANKATFDGYKSDADSAKATYETGSASKLSMYASAKESFDTKKTAYDTAAGLYAAAKAAYDSAASAYDAKLAAKAYTTLADAEAAYEDVQDKYNTATDLYGNMSDAYDGATDAAEDAADAYAAAQTARSDAQSAITTYTNYGNVRKAAIEGAGLVGISATLLTAYAPVAISLTALPTAPATLLTSLPTAPASASRAPTAADVSQASTAGGIVVPLPDDSVGKPLVRVAVTFDMNGGKVSGVKSTKKNLTVGEPYEFPSSPKRADYAFVGWYTSKTGGKQVTTDTVVTKASAHTLYARWADIDQTVKFDPAGGKVDVKSKDVKNGKKYGTLPTPTKKGYKFAGWYTAKKGGTKIKSTTKVLLAKTTKLYAHWTKLR
ncbi:MAG: S8 family serine peptidase [Clostridiales Family XIII bacterium]|jgi:uncharacterized repeat protein (TIGR02543 family)|nr:S8 family serine peptidase [Clostridiales Family XIII bacterium]